MNDQEPGRPALVPPQEPEPVRPEREAEEAGLAEQKVNVLPAYMAFLIVGGLLVVMVGVAIFHDRERFRYCDAFCDEGFMRYANLELVAEELEIGSRPQARSQKDQSTALHWAARFNHDPDVSALLIRLGAELDARDDNGATPLHYAAGVNPNLEITALLLRSGASIDAKDVVNKTPLHYAAEGSPNPRILYYLLEQGASVTATGEVGRAALHYAAWLNESPEVISELLEYGADPTLQDEFGVTPLHYAALGNEVTEIAALLLENGADPKVQTRVDGKTPLHAAAKENPNPEVLYLLLQQGADPGIRDQDGKLAVDYAEHNEELQATRPYELLRRFSLPFAN